MGTGNVAFKLNWLYGRYGPFTTACTAKGRDINIRLAKRTWCSQPECPCNEVWRRGNAGPPVKECPCYEVNAIEGGGFGGGLYHSGPKKGEPIPMRRAQAGKLAFLTSKTYDMREAERLVIGCYRIGSLEKRAEWHDIFARPEPGTELWVRDLSRAPRFWDYHRQLGGPRWNTGLFRYLPDEEAVALYAAVQKVASGGGE